MKTVIPHIIAKHTNSNNLSQPYKHTNHSTVNGVKVMEPGSIVQGIVVDIPGPVLSTTTVLSPSASASAFVSSSQSLSTAAFNIKQDGNVGKPSSKILGNKDENVFRNEDRDENCGGNQNFEISPKGQTCQNVCVVTITGHENLEKTLSQSSIFSEGKAFSSYHWNIDD